MLTLVPLDCDAKRILASSSLRCRSSRSRPPTRARRSWTLCGKGLGVSRMSIQSLRLGSSERTIPLDLGGRQSHSCSSDPTSARPNFMCSSGRGRCAQETQAAPAASYRGTVLEIPGSVVRGMIRNGQLHAAVALGDGRLFYVAAADRSRPRVRSRSARRVRCRGRRGRRGTCATSERPVIVPPVVEGSEGTAAAAVIQNAELAFDADFEVLHAERRLRQRATVADIENVMSAVNAVSRARLRAHAPDHHDHRPLGGLGSVHEHRPQSIAHQSFEITGIPHRRAWFATWLT